MTDLSGAALEYARAGFPVFPVKIDKTPLTPHGFKDATTDEATIRAWWTRWPDAGIGMPTGSPSGVVVLDVDPRNGGEDSMERMLSENGVLPRGPIVRTGGGGEHRYFAHPGGTVPPSHGFLPGLDLQGDGSYVILPPSPHKSGKVYEWVIALDQVARPFLPPWLFRVATEPLSSGRRQFEMGPGGKIPHGQHHDYIVSFAASVVSRTPGIGYEQACGDVLAWMGIRLDDPEKHEGEVADAVRSALGKYGRPGPEREEAEARADIDLTIKPISLSTRAEAEGAVGVKVPVGPTEPPVVRLTPPPQAEKRVETPIPSNLFATNPKTGEMRPDFSEFLGWFRGSERFVVPVERGTFSSPGSFELLRYEGGYYNGMARAYVRGRVEDAFRKVALASRDNFREEVVKGIAATSEFHRRRDGFNPAEMLCMSNGVIDTVSGTVGPHTPEIVFTWKMPVAYDPLATCPAFETFLDRVMPDPERRELLVDLMGYCLWRRNPFQAFFVNVGDGANGKTTWLRVMEELIGPDAIAAESLHNLSAQRFAPAELEGKLANLCDDLPYDRPLTATGVLKILTGEGEFTGERKFLPKFKFRFEGKLIANANRTPEVHDDTYAFWRRLVVIPWDVTIPEGERDPRLIDKLRVELPGILNLALQGLARCRGRTEFDPDGVFEGSREEWRARSDLIRAELLEEFEPDPDGFVPNRTLYEWHVRRSQSSDREPLTEKAFGMRVARAFPLSHPTRKFVAGKNVWGRPGLRHRNPSPVLDEDARDDAQRRLDEDRKAPDPAQGPATVISRQEETPPSPVLAGPAHTGLKPENPESRTVQSHPARTGDEAPSGPPPGLSPGPPPETSSPVDDEPPPPPPPAMPSREEIETAYRELLQVARSRRSTSIGMDEMIAFLEGRKYPRSVIDAAVGRACGEGTLTHLGNDLWRLKEADGNG